MQDKIIAFLKKKETYVSGEELSGHLGISRQALWKHIQELKESGYEIAAVPHLGYALVSVPDRLFPTEVWRGLNTKFMAKHIYYFETLPSTMDMAAKLAGKNAREGTLVLAEAQSKGRGRLGRSWSSPKYKGIYLSLILKPKIPPQAAPLITLLAAASICETIKEMWDLEPQIKWPNDILLGNKKVGGILTELNAETDLVRFLILGIGLNVNTKERVLPSGATSLAIERKEAVSRLDLLQRLLSLLEKNYLLFQAKGPEPIIQKWRTFNVTLGRRVKVAVQKEHLEALAQDIDKDGSLILRLDSGLTRRISAGDILHCR